MNPPGNSRDGKHEARKRYKERLWGQEEKATERVGDIQKMYARDLSIHSVHAAQLNQAI